MQKISADEIIIEAILLIAVFMVFSSFFSDDPVYVDLILLPLT